MTEPLIIIKHVNVFIQHNVETRSITVQRHSQYTTIYSKLISTLVTIHGDLAWKLES